MDSLLKIQALVGNIKQEQMRYVDYFVSDNLGIFLPVAGPCFYSITKNHTHPAYSFIVSHDGRCQIAVNNSVIVPTPGKLCAISPEVAHHEIESEQFSRYTAILINKNFFEQEFCLYNNKTPKQYSADFFEPDKSLNSLTKEFMLEYESNMPAQKKLLASVALRITHSIIRSLLQIKTKTPALSSRIEIEKAIEYIYQNYSNSVTVSEIAASTYLSTSHFSRLFKQETGSAPTEYLIAVRLDIAKRMLRANEMPITDIALACGFNSSSHFSSSFQHHFNLSPSQFIKTNRIKQET